MVVAFVVAETEGLVLVVVEDLMTDGVVVVVVAALVVVVVRTEDTDTLAEELTLAVVVVVVVVVAEAVTVVVHGGNLTVLLKSYTSILFGPPQNSERFPLQSMLHPDNPSGASSPPFWMEFPQSAKKYFVK